MRTSVRTGFLASTLLGTLLATATTASAMPIPDPTGTPYVAPPPGQVPAQAAVTSTPMWPYFVVGVAAVIVTLAAVALVSAARTRHIAKLRHA